MNSKQKKGISLILLVIVIMIMIVLAGTVILSLTNSGIISKANKSIIENDLATLQDEVNIKMSEKILNSENNDIFKLSELGIKNKYYENISVVKNGKLIILNSADENIKEIAKEKGMLAKGNDAEFNNSTLTIINTDGNNLASYRIYGNSVQNGIPTVENPIEIENLGSKTVNLFNKETAEKIYANI